MIREILTLKIDNAPVQYYISFDKTRKWFEFEPTLQNKIAPCFKIIVEENALITTDTIDAFLEAQAKEKANEIMNNGVYDHLR